MSEGLHFEFREDHLPNEKFFTWLKSNTALFIGQIAAIASLVLFAASFGYYVLGFHAGESHTSIDEYLDITKQAVFILNIVFCFLFIVFAAYIIHENKSGLYHSRLFLDLCFDISCEELLKKLGKEASTYLIQFKQCFLGYWCYLFAFYTFMASTLNSEVVRDVPKEVWVTLFNGFLFVLPFRMFSIISQAKNSVRAHLAEKAGEKKSFSSGSWVLHGFFPFLLFGVLTAIYWHAYKNIPASSDVSSFIRTATAISSCINLIALGLLISRLDSKLVGLPSWLTCVLFVYAAIQPLDIFIDEKTLESKMFSTISYVIVLIFKVYFFFIITYLLQTGRMYSYLQSNGVLSRKLSEARKKNNYSGYEFGMMTSFEKWMFSGKRVIFNSAFFLFLLSIIYLSSLVDENALINTYQVPEIANIIACLVSAFLLYILVYRKIVKGTIESKNHPYSRNLLIEMKKKLFNTTKDSRFMHKEKNNILNAPLSFYRYLILFFILTALLYVCLYFKDKSGLATSVKNNAMIFSIFFNSFSALLLFFAFVEIYEPSAKNEKHLVKQLYSFGSIFLLGFTVVGIISYFNHKNEYEFTSGDLILYGSSSINWDSQFIYNFRQETKLTEINYHGENDAKPDKNRHSKETQNEHYSKGLLFYEENLNKDTTHLLFTPIMHANKDVYNEIFVKGLIQYNDLEKYSRMDLDLKILADTLKIKCKFNVSPYYKDTCIQLSKYHFKLKTTKSEILKRVCFKVTGSSDSIFYDIKDNSLNFSHKGPYIRDTTLTFNNLQLIPIGEQNGEPLELPSFLTVVAPYSGDWLIRIFDALSGVLCALVFCLFISRVDSKFFGLPNAVTALLLIYAAIQVFFSIFNFSGEEFKSLMKITIIVALGLKLFFVMVMLYLYQSGRIYNYMGLFYELDWRADAVFANQYEFVIYKIHETNEYSFHIHHEDHKVMNLDHRFPSFKECNSYIYKLRTEMIKSDDGFFIEDKELNDRYGVHRLYKDFMDKRIFSKDFKNVEDLEHFSHEVHEQLPYCKVSIGV